MSENSTLVISIHRTPCIKQIAGFIANNEEIVIELGTFSYTQRRKDITDEEPFKILKHKRKSSVTSPVKTQEYIGEPQSQIIGTWAIGHDGRFVAIEKAEDYGLKDKND